MSYLQRLLDTAPALSVAPGDTPPSPIVARDQRLATFPDLVDPAFSTPTPDTLPSEQPIVPTDDQPVAEVKPVTRAVEAAPPTFKDAPPVAVEPMASPPPDPALPQVLEAHTIERGERVEHLPPLPEAMPPKPEPAHPVKEAIAPRQEAPKAEVRVPPLPEAPAPKVTPLWPITEADFQPVDQPAEPPLRVAEVQPAAPASPPQEPPPQAHPTEPVVTPTPVLASPEPQPRPAEPAMDLVQSPLITMPEVNDAPPISPAEDVQETQREVHTIERIVEKAAPPPPTPQTAAAQSVIGAISIGRMGPRERRARRWS